MSGSSTGTDTVTRPAAASGTFLLGGDLPVTRLGYGAMQITGPGIWGPPEDPEGCLATLRRAVELGVNFIDTAESYGPYVSEELIRAALHPYDGVVIATKSGLTRTGPGEWPPLGRPEFLRQGAEMSLRRLGLERIDLFQLHRIDPNVPAADSIGELAKLRDEGKIRHVGLSEVSVEEIVAAREIVEIASVQNLYNLANRQSEEVLDYCEREGIAFIPWFPMATGELAQPGSVLDDIAGRTGHSPAQLALAWLLHRSPVMLPIPGTKSVEHVAENIAAAQIRLSKAEYAELTALA
jgi:aryl-alcohol dehydrogenase-like predicted oxidoreductase